jgi:DNA-binding response OmpR family regulator
MRRSIAMTPDEHIEYLEGVIRKITGENSEIPEGLPANEFKVLSLLKHHRGRVVTREQIMEALYWERPEDFWPSSNIVDQYIHRLRRARYVIRVVYGMGWIMDKERADE